MQSPIPPIPTTADVAARLERAARILAPLVCLTIAAALTLAQCCYQCGYQLGSAVHERNDELARLWRRLWRVPGPAMVPVQSPITHAVPVVSAPVPVSTTAPAPPLVHPLAAMAEPLQALTVAQLRALTGTRHRMRKAELVSLALAMA